MTGYISELINQAIIDLANLENYINLPKFDVLTPKAEFGDFSTNAAMVFFKQIQGHNSKNPNDLAAKLSSLCANYDKGKSFAKIEPVGGFINFTLNIPAIISLIEPYYQGVKLMHPDLEFNKAKKVVFEYSSPNTNKALHIGHTRNDVYGKACINLLKAVGYQVISCEIINDRGIHIMKSILMYMKYGQGKTPESENMKPDHFVGFYYQMFGQKSSEGEEVEKQLLEEAQELLRKWEAGNEEVRSVWQQMNDWFFEGVKQTYKKEGSDFDEVDFESQIYDKGRDLVLRGLEKRVFQKEQDGSISLDLEEQGLGKKYLLRSDGTTLYITQDMYLWDLRNKRHNPDLAIVTTSAEQSYHFAVLKHIFHLLEYPWAERFIHLPYEHVYLGKSKMSSRSGSTISADDLLENVKEKVKGVMTSLDKLKAVSSDNELVTQIAFGAIKYGYLKYEPKTRIYFDIDQTISLQGNTGPYIQYAYARIQSILNKAGKLEKQNPSDLVDITELSLMRKLMQYEQVLIFAANEYKPNLVCNYLYELASELNSFYSAVNVLKENDQTIRDQRLTLLVMTGNVLKHGLNILGIEAPLEM